MATGSPPPAMASSPTSRSCRSRATYGTSFRAPALQTRAQTPFYYVIPLNDPASASGTTNTLFDGYVTNKSVQPEKSKSFTVGLELRPAALPISSSVSYFHTEYQGRITLTPVPNGGDLDQVFPNERLLGPYLVRNPDPKLVAAAFADPNFLGDYSSGVHGPAGVGALFYYGDTNVASSVNSGIDASASYRFRLGTGDANFSVFATYLIQNTFVPVKNGPQLEVLNDVGSRLDCESARTSRGPGPGSAAIWLCAMLIPTRTP